MKRKYAWKKEEQREIWKLDDNESIESIRNLRELFKTNKKETKIFLGLIFKHGRKGLLTPCKHLKKQKEYSRNIVFCGFVALNMICGL